MGLIIRGRAALCNHLLCSLRHLPTTYTKSISNSEVKQTHDQAFNPTGSSGSRQRLGIGPRVSSSSSVTVLHGPDQVEQSLEIFWPQDLLPQAIPDCRIASWSYNVELRVIRGSTSIATVFDHARTLLSDLAGVRVTEDERKRLIIFVAHSLGGIVVKAVRPHQQRGSIKSCVPRIYYFSRARKISY